MKIDAIRKNKKIIAVAIWIKEYAHALKVIGGLFFVLVFVMGLIWIFGRDVEPIAFIFALLSSLFFSSPSIAEYIVPSRKPIRHMTYDEILQFIKTTNPKTDWKLIHTNWATEAFLKEDMRLRIKARLDEAGKCVEPFLEAWATQHPDINAGSYWHDLLYDGALIERFILVSVDGGHADLPLPALKTLKVDPLVYKIAQIFDHKNSLVEYMNRSKLSVENA